MALGFSVWSMTDYYDAFGMSPVPVPGPDAVAPELFHGIYGMPSFTTIPTTDMQASADFWTRGLGFFDLFSIPQRLIHLRRWAFQDVLLVPATALAEQAPCIRLNFACVMNQIQGIADACRTIDPDCVNGPKDTPWNTKDIEVTTPEHARVVFTAAKSFDPNSQEAKNLHAIGISKPGNATR